MSSPLSEFLRARTSSTPARTRQKNPISAFPLFLLIDGFPTPTHRSPHKRPPTSIPPPNLPRTLPRPVAKSSPPVSPDQRPPRASLLPRNRTSHLSPTQHQLPLPPHPVFVPLHHELEFRRSAGGDAAEPGDGARVARRGACGGEPGTVTFQEGDLEFCVCMSEARGGREGREGGLAWVMEQVEGGGW